MQRLTYLFSRQFLKDLGLRLSGPAHFRFVIQPIVAIILGIRDGLSDARTGREPYIYCFVFHPEHRARDLREGWKTLGMAVIIAIVLDTIVQYLILGTVYVAAAVIVGTFLMAVPYGIARALTNRIASRRRPARHEEERKAA